MSTRQGTLVTLVWLLVIAASSLSSAPARQIQPKPAGNRSVGQPPSAKSATLPDDAAKKAAILGSYRWRRAMFEMNEWLSAQPFYDKKHVEEIKARLAARVAKMSAGELAFMLDDLDAKFQILDSKPAQEARAWMAQYLAVLSDKKREEVLKDLPNFATMTAAQLNQEVMKIQQKRAARAKEQAAYEQTRTEQVGAALQADRAAQQAYSREQNRPAATFSPYRSPPQTKPFENVHTGPDLQYYVNPYGGVGLIYSPNRW